MLELFGRQVLRVLVGGVLGGVLILGHARRATRRRETWVLPRADAVTESTRRSGRGEAPSSPAGPTAHSGSNAALLCRPSHRFGLDRASKRGSWVQESRCVGGAGSPHLSGRDDSGGRSL